MSETILYKVLFNDPDEFLNELGNDMGYLAPYRPDEIRHTIVMRATDQVGAFEQHTYVAQYLVVTLRDNRLVLKELRKALGTVWNMRPDSDETEKVQKAADTLTARIRAVLQQNSETHILRPGMIVSVEAAKPIS